MSYGTIVSCCDVTVTNSTCEGVIEYRCKNCDEKMIKSTSVNGHRPGAAATCTEPQVCEDCGTILQLPKGHTYESKVVAPTCTEMGYTVYRCKDCDDTYIYPYYTLLLSSLYNLKD